MGSFFRRATFLWFPTQTFRCFHRVIARNCYTGASSSLVVYSFSAPPLATLGLPRLCFASQ